MEDGKRQISKTLLDVCSEGVNCESIVLDSVSDGLSNASGLSLKIPFASCILIGDNRVQETLAMMREWLRETEAAKVLGRSVASMRMDRIRKRGVTYYKVGRKVLYSPQDLDTFLESSRVSPAGGVTISAGTQAVDSRASGTY